MIIVFLLNNKQKLYRKFNPSIKNYLIIRILTSPIPILVNQTINLTNLFLTKKIAKNSFKQIKSKMTSIFLSSVNNYLKISFTLSNNKTLKRVMVNKILFKKPLKNRKLK